MGWSQWSLGLLALQRDDLEGAAAALEASMALARVVGDRLGEIASLSDLSKVAHRRGEFARAETLARYALVNSGGSSHVYFAVGLEVLAQTAIVAGQVERAARLLGAAEVARETAAYPRSDRERAEIEQTIALARATLGEGVWAEAYTAGRALAVEDVVSEALGERERPHDV
jgi:ATP/maltotriose-dependent transcriptional regulator MalT